MTDKTPTPLTSALSTAHYNSSCADAAGMGTEIPCEDAYLEMRELAYRLERELAECRADLADASAKADLAECREKLSEEIRLRESAQAGNRVWRDRRDAALTEAEELRAKLKTAEAERETLISAIDVYAPNALGSGLSPSEAVCAFAGWLTGREDSITLGSTHECAGVAELVDAFCKSQGFAEPRHEWSKVIKPYPAPTKAAGQNIGRPGAESDMRATSNSETVVTASERPIASQSSVILDRPAHIESALSAEKVREIAYEAMTRSVTTTLLDNIVWGINAALSLAAPSCALSAEKVREIFNAHSHPSQNYMTEGQFQNAINAALAAAQPGWQPIETAPRDGTVILLRYSDSFLCGYGASTISKKRVGIGYFDHHWVDARPGGHGEGGGDSNYVSWAKIPDAESGGKGEQSDSSAGKGEKT